MSRKKSDRIEAVKSFSNVSENPEALKGKWAKDFFGNDNPIVLELACGKGEYTIALAEKFPDKNFIGVDIKGIRIWKGATIAQDKKLANAGFLRFPIDRIIEAFDKEEVSEIWITFPDPYVRKSKSEKRLVSSRFISQYRQFLKPDAFIHLKTDSPILFDYAKDMMGKENCKVHVVTEDLYNSPFVDDITSIKTTFEQRFLDQGLPIRYLKFSL